MKKVILLLFIFSFNAFSSEKTYVRVPLITESGKYLCDKDRSLPCFLGFDGKNTGKLCGELTGLGVLAFVTSPKAFSNLGESLCYEGDKGEVLEILNSLYDCVFLDQFTITDSRLKDKSIEIESVSNDDQDDYEWSEIKHCQN